ncbi:hypothetical protein VTI74DRAFT_7728 [Chaetomium olivicolor]
MSGFRSWKRPMFTLPRIPIWCLDLICCKGFVALAPNSPRSPWNLPYCLRLALVQFMSGHEGRCQSPRTNASFFVPPRSSHGLSWAIKPASTSAELSVLAAYTRWLCQRPHLSPVLLVRHLVHCLAACPRSSSLNPPPFSPVSSEFERVVSRQHNQI